MSSHRRTTTDVSSPSLRSSAADRRCFGGTAGTAHALGDLPDGTVGKSPRPKNDRAYDNTPEHQDGRVASRTTSFGSNPNFLCLHNVGYALRLRGRLQGATDVPFVVVGVVSVRSRYVDRPLIAALGMKENHVLLDGETHGG